MRSNKKVKINEIIKTKIITQEAAKENEEDSWTSTGE